jgi:hypothetical protein
MTMTRTVTVDGEQWAVVPSGFVTQYLGDEFGVTFSRSAEGNDAVRFSRYSPGAVRSREASFEALSDATLTRLFRTSQPSVRSPEGGYRS